MRLACWLIGLGLLLGTAAAQERHFSTGPDYLQIQPSLVPPTPLETPRISIQPPLELQFDNGPNYSLTSGSPMFAQPLEPPSISIPSEIVVFPEPKEIDPALYQLEKAAEALPLFPDLYPIYYGVRAPGWINVSFAEPLEQEVARGALPASIAQSGVVELTDMASLRRRGYGVTIAEAAAYWKTQRTPVRHVYTNEDIERLPRD